MFILALLRVPKWKPPKCPPTGQSTNKLVRPCHETLLSTLSPLRVNLQAANFKNCECASGSSKEPEPVPSASDVSNTAARPPSLS